MISTQLQIQKSIFASHPLQFETSPLHMTRSNVFSLLAIAVASSFYRGRAAVVPTTSGTVSARTVLNSSTTHDSRQAELSVTSARIGDDLKRPVRVVFSGYFNLTATVWLSPNETASIRDSNAKKPWTVTTALNFSALQGPLAVSFGAANAYAAANLTAVRPKSAQSAAIGGSVRLADKPLAGFGQAVGSTQGESKASAIGGAARVQQLTNTAYGAGSASIQMQAGSRHGHARGSASGIGNGELNWTARSSATAQGAGAAAGAGTSGDAYYGESEAHGDRRLDEVGSTNDTFAYGMGQGGSSVQIEDSGGGGGGGNGAAAGFGAISYAHHQSE